MVAPMHSCLMSNAMVIWEVHVSRNGKWLAVCERTLMQTLATVMMAYPTSNDETSSPGLLMISWLRLVLRIYLYSS